MKIIATLLLAAALPALAAEKNEPSAGERLLEVMQFEETSIHAGRAAMETMMAQMNDLGLPPAGKKELEKAFDEFLMKSLLDPEIKKRTIELYEESFSEAEILELINFYQTPLGQKLLTETPLITGKSMKMGMEIAQKYAPEFQQNIGKIIEKYQDGGAAEDKPEETDQPEE